MADTPFPFFFPTYPPPIFPGGCYPGFFPAPSPPPAFPPSPPSTFPYQPPASAYAPPLGFFPAPAPAFTSATYPHPPDIWSTSSTPSEPTSPTPISFPACGYPTAPAAFSFPCSQAPPPESTAPPTPESPTDSPVKPLPVPAPSEFSGDLSSRSPLCSHSMLQQRKEEGGKTEDGANPRYIYAKTCSDAHPVLPDYTCQGRGLIKRNSTSSSEILSVDNAGSTHRAVTHQDIPGELSKLSTSVYQLAASMGMQISEALATESSTAATVSVSPFSFTSLPGSTKTVVSALSTPPNAAAAASVTPELLDEMPTPSSCPRTYGTSLNYCQGQRTPIQCTCVPDGNNNLSEQNLGGMPRAYGLDNLKRRSVFLADGSEHSFYALPEDYPLEQATPPMSPPAEKNVDVMVPPSVAAHAAGIAPVLGFKANNLNTAGSESLFVPNLQLSMKVQDASHVFKGMHVYDMYEEEENACLNITSDVRDFSFELQQQDDERACNCSVLKTSNSFVTRYNLFSIVHSVRELRLLWDPGEHTIRSSTRNIDTVGVLQTSILSQDTANHLTECSNVKYLLQTFSHPHILSYSFILRYCSVECNWWLSVVLQSMDDQVEVMNPLSLNTPWDPGVLVMHSGFTQNSTRTTGDAQWLEFSSPTSCELPLSLSVKGSTSQVINNYLNVMFSMRKVQNTLQSLKYMSAIVTSSLSNLAILVLSASCREITEDCFANQELMANTASKVATLTWHNSLTGATFILLSIITYTWEIDNYTVSCQVQFSPLIAEHPLSLTACKQYIAPNDVTSVLHAICFTLQRAAHLIQDNYLSSLYCKSVLKTSYVWDPGVNNSLYDWLDILTVWSEFDKALSCTHIPDLAALRNQSVGSGVCYIWDPGTILLLYKSKWWLRYTEEKTNWHKDNKFYQVTLWLIHFLPP